MQPAEAGDLAQLSRETQVERRGVSADFIQAMKDAGARPSLVHQMERERARKR
jgi:hypothetical protein